MQSFIFGFILFCNSLNVFAAIYDETTYGDFHAGHVLPLTLGSNTISGVQGPGFEDRVDGFRFNIPNGYKASIDFNYTFTGLQSDADLAWIWGLYKIPEFLPCTPSSSDYECISAIDSNLITSQVFRSSPDFLLPSIWKGFVDFDQLVVLEGAYMLGGNLGFRQGDTAAAFFNYSVSISLEEVKPVPIPSIPLWLYTALAGCFFWRPINRADKKVNLSRYR